LLQRVVFPAVTCYEIGTGNVRFAT
jgi:hypothetical protein